jgi:Ion channel
VPDPTKARFPEDAIFFCSDCNLSQGKAKHEHLGRHFICPKEDGTKRHHARVILDQPAAKAWLRLEHKLLNVRTWFSPLPWLRRLWPKMEVGAYIIVSIAFLLVAILAWPQLSALPGVVGCPAKAIVLVLIAWRFADILLANTSITFTSRFPAHPIRSVLYSVLGYVQIALSFALFFLALGPRHFAETVSPAASIFYSFTTIATVGYGDLKPTTVFARLLVILELLVGLFFVAIILAQVAGWATRSRWEEGEYPLDELQ